MSKIRPISFEMVLMNFFIIFDVLIFGLDIEHIFDHFLILIFSIFQYSVFKEQSEIANYLEWRWRDSNS